MMEERYHVTTQNRFYLDMSNVNKNITVEAKLIRPPKYLNTQSKAHIENEANTFMPDALPLQDSMLCVQVNFNRVVYKT